MSERRIIYPPVWLGIGVVVIFALDEFLPGPRFAGAVAQLTGGALLVAGLALLVVAGGLFTRADTGLIPFRDTRALVTHGLYRYSRNPMYVAMALVLLGVAVTVGASLALLVPVLSLSGVALALVQRLRRTADLRRAGLPQAEIRTRLDPPRERLAVAAKGSTDHRKHGAKLERAPATFGDRLG